MVPMCGPTFAQELNKLVANIEKGQNLDNFSSSIAVSFKTAADRSIPLSGVSKCRNDLPSYIHDLLKLRKKWQREHKSYKTEFTKENLSSTIDCIKIELKNFRRKQWQDFIDKLGPHPLSSTPFWKRINRFRQKKRAQNIGTLLVDGLGGLCG